MVDGVWITFDLESLNERVIRVIVRKKDSDVPVNSFVDRHTWENFGKNVIGIVKFISELATPTQDDLLIIGVIIHMGWCREA